LDLLSCFLILLSGRSVTAATGHNLPVRVTFQFLLVVRPLIVLSGRYSASNLTSSLPQAGHNQA
jgi:hypothetical protein